MKYITVIDGAEGESVAREEKDIISSSKGVSRKKNELINEKNNHTFN